LVIHNEILSFERQVYQLPELPPPPKLPPPKPLKPPELPPPLHELPPPLLQVQPLPPLSPPPVPEELPEIMIITIKMITIIIMIYDIPDDSVAGVLEEAL
jgi:hypothetical protein